MVTALIWHCVYPWDIRVEKLLNLLGKKGHEIHLICKGRDGLSSTENFEHGQIHRLFVPPTKVGALLSKVLTYPLFLNPFWLFKIVRILVQKKANLIIVRDLPLTLIVGVIGKALKIPVVMDMAENYPAALIAYSNARYKPFLFKNGYLPRAYERLSLKFTDHVFVVADEQRVRLSNLGVSEEKISCVMNTPDLETFSNDIRKELSERPVKNQGITLLYVGKIDKHRGVDVLVHAMPLIVRHYPEARLRIIGDGTERETLIREVKELRD